MKNISLIAALAFVLFSCAEDEIKTYDAKDFIYFGNRTVASAVYWDTLQTFNFFFEPSFEEKVIELKVTRGGMVSATEDKEFLIDVKATAGTEGIDYHVERTQIMPAGKSSAYVAVTLYRTPILENNKIELEISLLPNENFTLDLPEVYKDRDTIQRTTMWIEYENTLGAPNVWDDEALGYFSPAKYFEMSKLFNLTIDDWMDNKRDLNVYLRHYSVAFMNYLNEQIAKGAEYAIKDPDAQSTRGYMSFPGYMNMMSGLYEVPPVIIPAEFPTTPEWEGN